MAYKYVVCANGEQIQISAKNSKGEIVAFVQLGSTKTLKRKGLLEIIQVSVLPKARGQGVGSELVTRAIKYALRQHLGIHMMIQPGSEGFWKKYFGERFSGKSITLVRGLSLNPSIKDGAVFEISCQSLKDNYKFPQNALLRNRGLEELCRQNENSLKNN